MQADWPLTREIVLIGGGHTHALVLRAWGMNPLPGARLTLINPDATAPYTGMLPGFVAGHYQREELEIDLVRLAHFAGARMIFGKVDGIDRAAQTISVPSRPAIRYDIAAIDIGAHSNMQKLAGFAEHGIPAKPLGPFAQSWTAFLANGGGPVAVIGGGIAGVELALAMRFAMGPNPKLTLIEAHEVLRGTGQAARDRLLEELKNAKIDVLENAKACLVNAGSVTLDTGQEIPSEFTVGAAGVRPYDWLGDTGLTLEDGYVAVDKTLRCLNDPNIFASGDCAHLTHAPRPKAGVFAVRAAPVLTANLRAAAMDKALTSFNPQSHYLKLVSLGRKSALADKWGRAIAGDWAWRWKDRIDRSFMDRLNAPPAMHGTNPPKDIAKYDDASMKPLCTGCGAKVSPHVLDSVLASLPTTPNDTFLQGAGDDAAVLRFGDQHQVLTSDHLRAVWDDPYLFARIAAVHALGDVWAMGVRPQAALAQITLPHMSEPLQEGWLAEIMQGAQEIFTAEGAAIVGGHSTMGAEFTLGFTVTGTGKPLLAGGANPGDALILTRPIGSGTLFAAAMQMKAQGDDIEAALQIMATPQGDAAVSLARVATAMTDVTGFGLAGHASRLAKAANVAACIRLDAVPIYGGAAALATKGIRSSIWSANRRAVPSDAPDTARGALLFDPQTAGGLLASVPRDQAESICADIKTMGHMAAIIGEIKEHSGDTLKLD